MDRDMFPSRHRVKITVLRKLLHEDLVEKYTDSNAWTPCTHFEVGQEFVVSAATPWDMPEGFCGWAWALGSGSSGMAQLQIPWTNQPRSSRKTHSQRPCWSWTR